MVAWVFAFAAGILVLQFCPSLPSSMWIYFGTGIVFFLLGASRVACFFLGFVWAAAFSWLVLNDRLTPEIEGRDIVVEGVVAGLPQRFGSRVRFDFKTEKVDSLRKGQFPTTIRLTWYYPPAEIRAGQKWRFTVRLKRPHGSLNPGAFDYERWLFLQRIGATGYVRSSVTTALLKEENSGFSVQQIRQNLDARLSVVFRDSSLVGLIKALVIGSRSEITAAQWKILRTTGTAHLVAISGLHIGLIAGLSFLLFRGLWSLLPVEQFSPSRLAAIIALIIASAYAALAGFSIPTQRAIIMVSVAMGGIVFQRHFKAVRVLVIALLLVLIYDPLAVLSAGFWLSFCAVFLIIFTASGRLENPKYWLGLLKIHWITAFGLAPLLLLFFQKASLIAPVANLIAVPVVSLIVVPVLLLALLFLFWIPSLGDLILKLAEQVLGLLWTCLQWLAEFPLAEWVHVQPSLWAVVLAVFAVILLFSPKGLPGRNLAVVLMLPLTFVDHPRPDEKDVSVVLLDVGQGLSVVVQTAHRTLVYDTGARFSDRFDMGMSVVAPFLRSRGIDKIDALVISHGDNDHIGGARSLANEYRIERLFTSVPKMIDWRDAIRCRAGESWTWDGVEFRFLSPFDEFKLKENDMSCVLQIIADGGNVLMPGDIEHASEGLLVRKYGRQLLSKVLIAPHHGSNTSSTQAFLESVKPKYALISAGYRNRFGFPKPEVLTRLHRYNIEVLNTAEAGAISVEIDAELGVSEPESYRLTSKRYWHQ